jgi:hypothetical protein
VEIHSQGRYFKNYPNIIAVRTYHPNAKIKGGKKPFKKEIVKLINERYNESLELDI